MTACTSMPEKKIGDSSLSPAELYSSEFKKICLSSSGKGRIEILNVKHTFSYESELKRAQNRFDMVLDFPVVGERELSLSLDPSVVNRTIKSSQITDLLKEQLGERPDQQRISKAIEEFFVFASDFMRFRANNNYPAHFQSSLMNDHFILERSTNSYRFVVDNFSANEKFFERTVFKIFIKNLSNDPILTLFLVPQSCDF